VPVALQGLVHLVENPEVRHARLLVPTALHDAVVALVPEADQLDNQRGRLGDAPDPGLTLVPFRRLARPTVTREIGLHQKERIGARDALSRDDVIRLDAELTLDAILFHEPRDNEEKVQKRRA